MKKFFITLLIIIALSAAAFFFGWANFAVPPGSYGVISSKSHGTDPDIIQAGEFRWIWYKLIPTNVNISVFRLESQRFPINFDSSLPSGDLYAQFIGLNNIDFSYELKGFISFAINPSKLISIASANGINNQEDLDNYMEAVAEKIINNINLYLSEYGTEELELVLSGMQDINLERKILSRFPEIKDFSFVINTAKYPDFILYTEIRKIYEDFLAEQRTIVTNSFGQRAESNIRTQLHFTELERYGELLTKYPILLDYLALKGSAD